MYFKEIPALVDAITQRSIHGRYWVLVTSRVARWRPSIIFRRRTRYCPVHRALLN